MERDWEHQTRNVEDHALDSAHALFWPPRCGKTRAALGHIKRLDKERGVRKTLIVAPQLPLRTTWYTELMPFHAVLYDLTSGRVADRRDKLNEIIMRSRAEEAKHAIVLVNYDVVQKLKTHLLRWRPQLIISDESHLIKTAGAGRSSALHLLGKYALYRRALTGTPDPKSYEDYYSIYKFLDPKIFGTRITAFRERYLHMHPLYSNSVTGYKSENLEELRSKIYSIASRVRREDIFDMPQVLRVTRNIEMSDKAWSMYKSILNNHEFFDDWFSIDAPHRIARLGILQRLTGGFVYENQFATSVDARVASWVHKAKVTAAVEEVADIVAAGELTVVFFLYRAEGEEIERAMREAYGDIVARLDGGAKAEERLSMTAPFDPARSGKDSGPRILVVQEKVGSLGISFANANHAIFYSYSMNHADHTQAQDRVWKSGSDKKITLTYLQVPGSADPTIRKIVEDKDFSSKKLLDIGFQQLAKGEI